MLTLRTGAAAQGTRGSARRACLTSCASAKRIMEKWKTDIKDAYRQELLQQLEDEAKEPEPLQQ